MDSNEITMTSMGRLHQALKDLNNRNIPGNPNPAVQDRENNLAMMRLLADTFSRYIDADNLTDTTNPKSSQQREEQPTTGKKRKAQFGNDTEPSLATTAKDSNIGFQTLFGPNSYIVGTNQGVMTTLSNLGFTNEQALTLKKSPDTTRDHLVNWVQGSLRRGLVAYADRVSLIQYLTEGLPPSDDVDMPYNLFVQLGAHGVTLDNLMDMATDWQPGNAIQRLPEDVFYDSANFSSDDLDWLSMMS